MWEQKKQDGRDVPKAPLVYHPDTGETEALPGMGTYVGCPACECALVPDWGWCPYCGQRLAW